MSGTGDVEVDDGLAAMKAAAAPSRAQWQPPAGRLRSPCLAHRPPFLMIDRIGHVDRKARSLVALRDLTFDDPFLTRQRRGPPLYPAVLLVEMIGQAILSLLNVFPQPGWRTAPAAGPAWYESAAPLPAAR